MEQKTKKPTKKATNKRNELGIRRQEYSRFNEGDDYEPVEGNDMVAIINLIQKQDVKGRQPKYESIDDFICVINGFWEYLKKANASGEGLIPDIEGFCCFAGISRETLNVWEKNRDVTYADTIKRLKNSIAFCKKQLALKGKIPPIVFATDFNNNHGYTQKQEVVLTPNNPLGDIKDVQTLKETYLDAIPEDAD